MRKLSLLIITGISFFILVGASVWEGAAELSEDLPETGWYIATNSLPKNSVVDVTNLENGKSAQLVVSSGLHTSGFLALLSKDAANALGIEKGSLSRIRLSQNPDPLAFSRTRMDPGIGADYEDFTLVPDRSRPPEGGPVPDLSQFIPSVTTPPPGATPGSEFSIDPSLVIEPVRATPPSAPAVAAPPASGFSTPMISVMEKGKYYVQVAAYSNPDSVEYEITRSRRIDESLPVVIMETGNGDKPIYRVLIGPISNFGESGAILDRCKSIYPDAFVWQGQGN